MNAIHWRWGWINCVRLFKLVKMPTQASSDVSGSFSLKLLRRRKTVRDKSFHGISNYHANELPVAINLIEIAPIISMNFANRDEYLRNIPRSNWWMEMPRVISTSIASTFFTSVQQQIFPRQQCADLFWMQNTKKFALIAISSPLFIHFFSILLQTKMDSDRPEKLTAAWV